MSGPTAGEQDETLNKQRSMRTGRPNWPPRSRRFVRGDLRPEEAHDVRSTDRKTGGNVAVSIDQHRGWRSGGAERFPRAEPLIEEDRRVEPVLLVRFSRAGGDEDKLRRACGFVVLPPLDVLDEPLAKAAARVPEEERRSPVADLFQVHVFSVEIGQFHRWRFAADLYPSRRRGCIGLGGGRGIQQVRRL